MSTKTKQTFTPGPWKITRTPKNDALKIRDNLNNILCAVWQTSGNAEANAALIASAPELLAAAYEAANMFHDLNGDDICSEKNLCEYCKVIAKAEGR